MEPGKSRRRIQRLACNPVYENDYLTLFDDPVRFPSGAEGNYLRVAWKIPFSVAVLPVTREGAYVLIRQYCYAREDWVLQVPKGMGRAGVEPAALAAEELRQETGFQADSMQPIRAFFANPGFSATPAHAFFARGARRLGKPEPEAREVIEGPVLVPREKAGKDSWLAGIEDTLTLTLILLELRGQHA